MSDLFHILFQFGYMSIYYIFSLLLKNCSFVDFAWPSGFFLMSLIYFFTSNGYWLRKLLIVSLYCLAGFRFMFGWLKRGHLKHEDSRWNLWRKRWSCGDGIFGIKSISINTFFFFHAQSMSNAFFMNLPLKYACHNEDKHIYFNEILAVFIWMAAFYFENIADLQRVKFLARQKKENKPWGGINKDGLWRYSRHPNYFCELFIWISYFVFGFSSVKQYDFEFLRFLLLPYIAYLFLVKFTGIFITDKSMLEKRKGTPFEKEMIDYIESTNEFFPWFPKTKTN